MWWMCMTVAMAAEPIVWLNFDAVPVTDQVSGATWQLRGDARLTDTPAVSDLPQVRFDSGRALALDGDADYAETPFRRSYQPAAFTVAAWVHPTSFGGDQTLVVSGNTDGLTHGFWWTLASGRPTLYMGGESSEGFIEPFVSEAEEVPLGQWTHLAASFDGNTVRLYRNGLPAHQESLQITVQYMEDALVVGHMVNRDYDFEGSIDEVQLYDLALTDAEVIALYASYVQSDPGGDTGDTGDSGVEDTDVPDGGGDGPIQLTGSAPCACGTSNGAGAVGLLLPLVLVGLRRRR